MIKTSIVTGVDSLYIKDKPMKVLEGINETFFVSMQAGDIKMRYENKHLNSNISSKANNACLTDSCDAFFTNFRNKSINYFSLDTSGNASLLFSAASSIPYGICQAALNKELALLVTLMEMNRKYIN